MTAPTAPEVDETALATSARAFYAALAAMTARAAGEAVAGFGDLDPAALTAGWEARRLGERLFVSTATWQTLAVELAARYVENAVRAQGVVDRPDFALDPRAFAGVASDGRDLETLLAKPLALTASAATDRDPAEARRSGMAALATIVETQVSDAGRAATQTAMVARREVTGFVRMLTPPSCGRCAILAGRRYAVNAGFARHPRCDCTAIPAVEDVADDLRTDPDAYFASLSRADQARYFGPGAAEAIRAGADMGRVVNASRSRRSGLDDPGRRRGGRVMPGELVDRADGDRDQARRLLEQHGYLRT